MTTEEAPSNEHTEYGVNVSNKFAFLDEDIGDPAELLARALKEKKAAKQQAKAKAAAPAAPAAPAPVKNEKENNENRRPVQQNRAGNDRRLAGGPRGRPNADKFADRLGEKSRDENRAPRRDGPPRDFNNRPPRRENNGNPRPPRRDGPPRNENRSAPAQNNEDVWAEGGDSQPAQEGADRPAYGGKPRTFRNGGGNGPRRFDRVSGSDKTGVRGQTKKQGHGPGNWGTPEDQLAGETDPVNLTADENKPKVDGETPAAEGGDENAAAGGEENADAEPKEPEAPKMTLEEWKAQHATAKVEFKTRQANEGADDKSLQKFVPLKREEAEAKKEAAEEENKKKKGQRSNVVNIELSFNDPNRRDYGPRRGGERGGDRDFRAGGGAPGGSRGPIRGGPRVPHHSQKLDSNDFPALGAR